MQQAMTRWIEMADARAACQEAMAQQMLAHAPHPQPPKTPAPALCLESLVQTMNRCFGLGQVRPQD